MCPTRRTGRLWSPQEITEVKTLAAHFATKAWADIMALQGNLNYQHDYYLKQYQLTHPIIKKDFLMLDEGQDTNPAVLDIFERQGEHAQLIMVGDTYQSIYQWRGAVDAMSAFEADDDCYLTKSFRFGPAIAEEANKWLTLLGADKPLEGFDRSSRSSARSRTRVRSSVVPTPLSSLRRCTSRSVAARSTCRVAPGRSRRSLRRRSCSWRVNRRSIPS